MGTKRKKCTSTSKPQVTSRTGMESLADRFAKVLQDNWETAPHIMRCDDGSCEDGAHVLLPWGDVLGMLRAAQAKARPEEVEVLVFKDGCPTTEYASCHAAYLDGCSIVVNHIDKAYAPVNSMCAKLREHIPHVFTNMYLTPPEEQAVAPHADDRDVLVLQVAGSKTWKVYDTPPVPFPYPSEQVGKSEAYPVPQETLAAEPLINTVLQAGDILYMPRGFVHEALTSSDASLHLTFALPTHDWSWASVVTDALRAAGRGPEECAKFRTSAVGRADCGKQRASWFWRRAVPPALVCSSWSESAREAAQREAAAVAKETGLDGSGAIIAAIEAKAAHFNKRQADIATAMPAMGLSLATSSYVRRLTEQEKEHAEMLPQYGQRGIVAREELVAAIPRILQAVKTEPVCISAFEDCHTLCPFGKVCFAGVCIDQALFCVCDAAGMAKEGVFTCESKPSQKKDGIVQLKKRGLAKSGRKTVKKKLKRTKQAGA